MLKITLTLTLTLTYTRPPMFDRLQRRNNSHFVKFFISPADCGVWTYPHFYTDERPCGTVQMVHVGCVCVCVCVCRWACVRRLSVCCSSHCPPHVRLASTPSSAINTPSPQPAPARRPTPDAAMMMTSRAPAHRAHSQSDYVSLRGDEVA